MKQIPPRNWQRCSTPAEPPGPGGAHLQPVGPLREERVGESGAELLVVDAEVVDADPGLRHAGWSAGLEDGDGPVRVRSARHPPADRPPRSHSSWKYPKPREVRVTPDLGRGIPARALREIQPEGVPVAGSKCQRRPPSPRVERFPALRPPARRRPDVRSGPHRLLFSGESRLLFYTASGAPPAPRGAEVTLVGYVQPADPDARPWPSLPRGACSGARPARRSPSTYVIVRAGAAGSVVASRLTESPEMRCSSSRPVVRTTTPGSPSPPPTASSPAPTSTEVLDRGRSPSWAVGASLAPGQGLGAAAGASPR